MLKTPEPPPPDWLGLTAAARYLGRSPSWLRRHLSAVPHYTLGRDHSFMRSDLDAFLANNRKES